MLEVLSRVQDKQVGSSQLFGETHSGNDDLGTNYNRSKGMSAPGTRLLFWSE